MIAGLIPEWSLITFAVAWPLGEFRPETLSICTWIGDWSPFFPFLRRMTIFWTGAATNCVWSRYAIGEVATCSSPLISLNSGVAYSISGTIFSRLYSFGLGIWLDSFDIRLLAKFESRGVYSREKDVLVFLTRPFLSKSSSIFFSIIVLTVSILSLATDFLT